MIRDKGEGSIYQRSDGLWCTSVELPPGLDGKRRRKVICRKDKGAVTRELRNMKKELIEHGDIATNTMSVEEWFTYWLEKIMAPKVRPKTYMGHRSVVTGHIIPAIGKVKLNKLTPAHIRKVQQRVLATPKDPKLRGEKDLPEGTVMLAPSYAKTVHAILSTGLAAAVKEGRIRTNPAEKVDAPRALASERKALSLDESIQLLEHLGRHKDAALWACYLLTGARRGEILGLEADRVTDILDLSWQLQRISNINKAPDDFEYRQVASTLYLTRPKSKAGWRIIPLVEPLKSVLQRHMDAGNHEGLIFTDAGKPWNPDDISDAWKELLAEAGLPDDIVLHGSRHTTVDLLYEAGVPEAVIMEIVGHTTRAVTRGYKSRGNRRQLEDAMQKMSALLAPRELTQ